MDNFIYSNVSCYLVNFYKSKKTWKNKCWKRKNKPWYKKLRSEDSFDDNLREEKAYGGGEENNASMKIYEETGTYHCFTCKDTGNAISFLKKHDNLDFIEAVELLASYVGMEIPKQEKSAAVTKSTNINNKAAEIFYTQLKEENSKNTISYLKDNCSQLNLLQVF